MASLGVLYLGEYVRCRAAARWERVDYHNSTHLSDNTTPPNLKKKPANCAARRRARAVELRVNFTFGLKREQAVVVLHPPEWPSSLVRYCNSQVCRGEEYRLRDYAIAPAAVPAMNDPANDQGLWQQVRLSEQWWPLLWENYRVVQGMGPGTPKSAAPPARRRRPVPYMRICECYGDAQSYIVRPRSVAVFLADGGTPDYLEDLGRLPTIGTPAWIGAKAVCPVKRELLNKADTELALHVLRTLVFCVLRQRNDSGSPGSV